MYLNKIFCLNLILKCFSTILWASDTCTLEKIKPAAGWLRNRPLAGGRNEKVVGSLPYCYFNVNVIRLWDARRLLYCPRIIPEAGVCIYLHRPR